ncbi:MAG: MraY family glycosyltransferase [Chlamydiota bacterium]
MWGLVYAYLFALSLALSLLLTPLARRAAVLTGMLDVPGERKAHRGATPLLGGAAIFAAVALTILLNSALAFLAARGGPLAALVPAGLSPYLSGALAVLPKLAVILLGGLVIFLIGLWDDAVELSPRVKLLGQLLMAVGLVALDVRITLFVPSYLFSALVTVAWVVVITNSFNLLDNMDGLCAGVACIVSALMGGISALSGNYFIASLFAVLAGSLLGFLRYNFNPAGIFMGDAGSMFIGYFIAVMSVMQTWYRHSATGSLAVAMPLVILAVPIYDTLSVIVIRISRGQSIFRADRRHFSHRLTNLGMSVRGAVLFVYLVTLCTGLSAVFLPRVGWRGGTVVFVQVALVVSVIAILEYFGSKKNGGA